VVLAGDSAGGSLALATLLATDASLPPPAGLLLLSPWVRHTRDTHIPPATATLQLATSTMSLQGGLERRRAAHALDGRQRS